MAYKKIDREYKLTDSSVNCYGFRLLTTGYQADKYKANPIGYHMHGTKEHSRETGVLLKWEDFRQEGDAVYAKPCINLNHPRGQQTVEEIEEGFLNAASMGHFVVLEQSDDPALKLAGQTGPTVTKWYNRECSLVDIPGNYDALALFDAKGDEINLADFTKPSVMKQFVFPIGLMAGLNLTEASTQENIDAALQNLAARAAAHDTIKTERDALKTEITSLKAEATKGKVTAILDKAVTEKGLSALARTELEKQYSERPDELQSLVAVMPAYKSITSQLNAGQHNTPQGQDWDTLDREGKLENLKATDLEAFKLAYKNKFDKEYGA